MEKNHERSVLCFKSVYERFSISSNDWSSSIISVKRKVYFCYYRLAKGIRGILSYAKEGVRLWFRTKRPAYRQICLKLVA